MEWGKFPTEEHDLGSVHDDPIYFRTFWEGLHKMSIFGSLHPLHLQPWGRKTTEERKTHSAVKQRGRERKGPSDIIQKFRLRKWPISTADFPMSPMEKTEHHFGPFCGKDFGAISGGPFFSRPLFLTVDTCITKNIRRDCLRIIWGCWLSAYSPQKD